LAAFCNRNPGIAGARAKSMKVASTFIVNFALTALGESKLQLKGGFTFQHLTLASFSIRTRRFSRFTIMTAPITVDGGSFRVPTDGNLALRRGASGGSAVEAAGFPSTVATGRVARLWPARRPAG
jgi:hypothetical protein